MNRDNKSLQEQTSFPQKIIKTFVQRVTKQFFMHVNLVKGISHKTRDTTLEDKTFSDILL